MAYFNPRSLHGERPTREQRSTKEFQFQSTLPARGATISCFASSAFSLFQSTLPARGATQTLQKRILNIEISIHAPCTGSDRSGQINFSMSGHFNPRSLHGERHLDADAVSYKAEFQSTLPARGATRSARKPIRISCDFNPRSLHGERRLL